VLITRKEPLCELNRPDSAKEKFVSRKASPWQTGLPYYAVSLLLEIQLQGKLDLPCGCGSVRPSEGLSG